MIDEEELMEFDIPFLNRLEKHYLQNSDFITSEDEVVVKELKQWINNLCTI